MTEIESIQLLEKSNIQMFEVFTTLCIFVNICLCMDVFFVFRNPFYPTRLRTKWYISFSLIGVFCVKPFQRSMLYKSNDFFRLFVGPLIG
jgi:hypothetical protein